MQPPIAEIPPPAPRRAVKQAPPSLTVAVGLGVLLGIVDICFGPGEPFLEDAQWSFALFLVLMLTFHFVPLYFLWRGHNWARWTLIVLGVMEIVFSFWPEITPPSDWVNWLYLPYNLGLIALLLTPAMRRHFAGIVPDSLPAQSPRT